MSRKTNGAGFAQKKALTAELAMLLDHDTCIRINEHDMASLRSGTFPRAKLDDLVSTMRARQCGWTHTSAIDPKESSRLKLLPHTHFKVLKIDSTRDSIFHAFLQGLSFIIHGHCASARTLKASTAAIRAKIVRRVLTTKSLQNAMALDPSTSYQRQFETQSGAVGKRSYILYSQKMQRDAFGSYTELAALSRVSGIEIHVYEKHADDYAFVLRYLPGTRTKQRHVMRVLRSPRATVDHFDLLVQIPFLKYSLRGFWNHVNRVLLGKLGGNAINSPERALALLNNSTTRRSSSNASNLPNENSTAYTKNNFKWNETPIFTMQRRGSAPNNKNVKKATKITEDDDEPEFSGFSGSAGSAGSSRSAVRRVSPRVASPGQWTDEVRNALRQLARNA